jgi:RimJ/RimL family protein N-acetyltransferase
MGFQIEGEIRNAIQIQGRWFDDYVMGKTVEP